jgi:tRNA/rRNA methyltransferase
MALNSSDLTWPILILVRPEISENLGFVARTMRCYGLTRWRIVGSDHLNVQPGGPAWKTSSGAEDLLSACERVSSLEEAVSDCQEVWGFSRRSHGTLSIEWMEDSLANLPRPMTKQLAWVFGPESQGLSSQDAPFIQRWVRIDSNHPTMSLNLSHAIAIAIHAWQSRIRAFPDRTVSMPTQAERSELAFENLAERGLLEKGWAYLEQAVCTQQVFPPSKEKAQLQHLRNLWNRMVLTRGEGEFLVGILKVLLQGRQARNKTDSSNLADNSNPGD